MTSLYRLAIQKQLPDHQYMDSKTLTWMISQKPKFDTVEDISIEKGLLEDTIDLYTPEDEWFLEPKTIDSIHGIRHIVRCLVYVQLITERLSMSKQEQVELLIATSLHDCRRLNDKGDINHGKRGKDWFERNQKELQLKWKALPLLDTKKIAFLIESHEHHLKNFEITEGYKQALGILKLADALDRYRQPKVKWWINSDYLFLKPLEKEMKFAFYLVTKSEENNLKKKGAVKSVNKTLKE